MHVINFSLISNLWGKKFNFHSFWVKIKSTLLFFSQNCPTKYRKNHLAFNGRIRFSYFRDHWRKIIIISLEELAFVLISLIICNGIADFGIAQAFNSCTSSQVLSRILFSILWVLCKKKNTFLDNTNICQILIKIVTMIKEGTLWKSFLMCYMHDRQNLEMLLCPHS